MLIKRVSTTGSGLRACFCVGCSNEAGSYDRRAACVYLTWRKRPSHYQDHPKQNSDASQKIQSSDDL